MGNSGFSTPNWIEYCCDTFQIFHVFPPLYKYDDVFRSLTHIL